MERVTRERLAAQLEMWPPCVGRACRGAWYTTDAGGPAWCALAWCAPLFRAAGPAPHDEIRPVWQALGDDYVVGFLESWDDAPCDWTGADAVRRAEGREDGASCLAWAAAAGRLVTVAP